MIESFILLFAVGAFEMWLTVRWNVLYYRSGIPVYRRHAPAPNKGAGVASRLSTPAELERRVAGGPLVPLVFRAFSSCEYAFREHAFVTGRVGYPTVMHGIVELRGGHVVVTGYANWLPIAISLWCLSFGYARWLIGLFLVMYIVQERRFRGVAEVASASWREGAGEDRPPSG